MNKNQWTMVLLALLLAHLSCPGGANALVVQFGQDTTIADMNHHRTWVLSPGGMVQSESDTALSDSHCNFDSTCQQKSGAEIGVLIDFDFGCWDYRSIRYEPVKVTIAYSYHLQATALSCTSGEEGCLPTIPINLGTSAHIRLYGGENLGAIELDSLECEVDSNLSYNCSGTATQTIETNVLKLLTSDNQIDIKFTVESQSSAGGYATTITTGHAEVTIDGITIEFLNVPGCTPEEYYPTKDLGPDPDDTEKESGDPVNIVNGNVYVVKTDLSVPAPGMPFEFTRSYNSTSEEDGPLGVGWTHDYDLKLRLPEDELMPLFIKVEKGREVLFTKKNPGEYIPGRGEYSNLTQTETGFLWEKKDKKKYFFDSDGILQKIQDKIGNTVLLRYDELGNLITVEDTAGRSYQFAYDTHRRITGISDPTGRTVTYQYDGSGNLIKVIDPMGGETTYEYTDPNDVHNITRKKIDGDFIFTYDYDDEDRCIHASGTSGEMGNTFGYFPDDHLTTITDSTGNTTIKYFDEYGKVTGVMYPDGVMKGINWDSDGNKVANGKFGSDGTVWSSRSWSYDERGNVTLVFDTVEPCTDDCDYTWRMMTYDEEDNLTSLTDELGRTTTYAYDNSGNLVETIYPDGTQSGLTYNSRGQVLTFSDAAGNTTSRSYDAQGNVLTVTNPAGDTVSFAYDALGRKIGTTNALGNATNYQHDLLGRVVKVTDALGGEVVTTHAVAGIGSLVDQVGNTASFQYDSLNQLVAMTDPFNHSQIFAYDPNGNMSSRTDYSGSSTTYAYDEMNRLTATTYPDGSAVDFSYDPNGRLAQTVDSTGDSSYTYNARGSLTAYTNTQGRFVAYDYDEAGNLIRTTYPDNKSITYLYDSRNRLVQVEDWAGRRTNYSYDPRGLLIEVNLPNGTKAKYDYDSAGRVTGLRNLKANDDVIAAYSYVLDQNGNIVSETSEQPLEPIVQSQGLACTYGPDNRLASVNGESVGYDQNGNMVAAGDTTYQYDFENRLKTIVCPGNTWEYDYDGKGRRIGLTHNGSERHFLLDPRGMTNVLAEYDGDNDLTAYYIYGLGLLCKIDAAGDPYYYHYNFTGHTVAMTDANGDIVNRYAYTPFGVLSAKTEAVPNPFRYVGRFGVMDDDNGLLYMRARYYDPDLGRFLTKDPIGFEGGVNLYAYAADNPVVLIDPAGLCLAKLSGILWSVLESVVPMDEFTGVGYGAMTKIAEIQEKDPTFGPDLFRGLRKFIYAMKRLNQGKPTYLGPTGGAGQERTQRFLDDPFTNF